MILLPITASTTAFLSLIFGVCSFRVIRLRQKNNVSLGHNNNQELERAIRSHGNFSEYIPLCLFLMLMLELHAANIMILISSGFFLIIGRLCHIRGIVSPEHFRYRIAGMMMTFIVMFFLSFYLLYYIWIR